MAGGISPEYFLDRMEVWELGPLLEGLFRARRDGWEQARFIAVTAANASDAKLGYSDIHLPWDDDDKKEAEEKPNAMDVERLRERVKKLNDGKK